MSRILNRSDAADFFAVSLPTIDEWMRQGCPHEKPSAKGGAGYKIDPAQVLDWHRVRERQNALGDIAKIDEDEARRRKLAAEAALAEHKLAMEQKSAVAVVDVFRALASMVTAFRARLLGMGNKLGPIVASQTEPIECQALIDASVHEALHELSEFQPDDTSSDADFGRAPDGPGDVSVTPDWAPGAAAGATEGGKTVRAGAKTDRERVGGRKATTPRGKR